MGNVSIATGSRLAEKFLLTMILLAGKKDSFCWKLDEKKGLDGGWEQLFLSQQVKKFNRLSS